MAAAVYALGIDSSTQSCSAIVLDLTNNRIVAEDSINFGQALPQYGAPQGFIPPSAQGQAENEIHSDPLMWLDALDMLMQSLGQKCDLAKVKFVSGAGQQHGSVYLNSGWFETVSNLSSKKTLSEQIRPCLSRKTSPIWMDTSTTIECEEIGAAVGSPEEVCRLSGSIPTERFTGPQIRKFFKTSTRQYQDTRRIHLVSSFIGSIIAGADSPIDTGDGAGMNLMNIASLDWDENLVNATAPDLVGKLPRICHGDYNITSSISHYFVNKYGFSDGCAVVIFTGDNPSSLVGMAANSSGAVVISLGTSDTFFAAMDDPCTDPNGSGHVFGNPVKITKLDENRKGLETSVKEARNPRYMTLQCFLNGSLAREKVRDYFGMSWHDFSNALSNTVVGNHSNIMLPFFGNEISPKIIGSDIEPSMQGDDDFNAWKRPNETVRACVECQMMNMKCCVEWMHLSPTQIFLTGGASENDHIAQIVANVFQTRVSRLKCTYSCSLGGALRAASYGKGSTCALQSLQEIFCRLDNDRDIMPSITGQENMYDKLLESYRAALLAFRVRKK